MMGVRYAAGSIGAPAPVLATAVAGQGDVRLRGLRDRAAPHTAGTGSHEER